MDVDRNHPPIMKALILAGETLLTKDRPMGDRQSSASVTTAYVPNNQAADALTCPSWETRVAPSMIAGPPAVNNKPRPIFAGVDGSRPPRRRKLQKLTTTRVNMI